MVMYVVLYVIHIAGLVRPISIIKDRKLISRCHIWSGLMQNCWSCLFWEQYRTVYIKEAGLLNLKL